MHEQKSREFEGSNVNELVIEFYDLMEKEEMKDTPSNREKIFKQLLETTTIHLDEEELEKLQQTVLMKKETVTIDRGGPRTKRERRSYIN